MRHGVGVKGRHDDDVTKQVKPEARLCPGQYAKRVSRALRLLTFTCLSLAVPPKEDLAQEDKSRL